MMQQWRDDVRSFPGFDVHSCLRYFGGPSPSAPLVSHRCFMNYMDPPKKEAVEAFWGQRIYTYQWEQVQRDLNGQGRKTNLA